jgi:hypothetical protein
MKIFYKVIHGCKVRIFRFYFCIGIGMDQFTPVYHRFVSTKFLGLVKSQQRKSDLKSEGTQPQSKSLATTNYNKRARHKN